jgi:hypothetical protein
LEVGDKSAEVSMPLVVAEQSCRGLLRLERIRAAVAS